MSKKLIAVASAAALALTALVGVAPASATTPTIAETATGSTGSGTAAAPYVVDVPSAGKIQVATDNTAISILADSLAIGDVVTFTSTGAVKMLETEVTAASKNFNATTLGKSSFTYTKTNTTAVTIYAYTTSTTVGTVVASIARTGGTTISETFYIEGLAGVKYKVASVVGMPTSLSNTATATVSFQVTDAFDNVIENDAANISTGNTRSNVGAPTWNATKKVYEVVVTSPSSSAFVASLDIGAATIDGFSSPTDSFAGVINNSVTVSQITVLTAQVTSLTADYNALAAKWNKRVAAKTAPKKKVALK
jgi:hypothetical protein